MKKVSAGIFIAFILLSCSSKKGYKSDELLVKSIDSHHSIVILKSTGEQAFEGTYTYIAPFDDGYAIVSDTTDQFGVIDSTGTLILPIAYQQLWYSGEDMFSFTENDRIGFIDSKGALRIPAIFGGNAGARPRFSEGVCAVMDSTDTYITFINKDGKKAMDFTITGTMGGAGSYYFPEFHDGLAVAHKNYVFGYINHKGEWAIPPQFDNAHRFGDGLAAVRKKGEVFFIDTKGNRAIARSFGAIDEGCCGFDYGFFHKGRAQVNVDTSQKQFDISDDRYDFSQLHWAVINKQGIIVDTAHWE